MEEREENVGMKPLSKSGSSPPPAGSNPRWMQHYWPSVKPFVYGGAAGFFTSYVAIASSATVFYFTSPDTVARFQNNPTFHLFSKENIKIIPRMILANTFIASQLLGLFEILRRKAISTNDGMPPMLHQEAACGLAAGAIATCIRVPLYLHVGYCRAKIGSPNFFAKPWTLAGLARYPKIWTKGMGPYVRSRTSLDFGMLASYNPSLRYLKESCGFSQSDAQLGASAISGLCAVACESAFRNVSSLDSALKILKSRGPLAFCTGIPSSFVSYAPNVMVTWAVLEEIRKREKSIGG
ncbi:mitochondrial dicarboxylate/tricarboxylate transporter DTC-like [Pyrus communis]|uniref:mitochondrial dicarboxylate/tricarboxylate transporter DTC-like n=1 Tax=Pyrus communis TaxID=23211 RepID=UPI0035C07952